MKSRKIKIRKVQLLTAVFIVFLILFVPLTALAGWDENGENPGTPEFGTGVTGGGPDVQIGNPADVPPSSGEPGSTFPDQQQSLSLSPEQPLTTLPATGGAIFPALVLSLLLAGSGAVIIRKFKENKLFNPGGS